MKKRTKVLTLLSMFLLIVSIVLINESVKLSASTYNPSNTYYIEVDVDDPMTIEEIVDYIDLKASLGEADLSDYIVNVNGLEYISFVLLRPQAFMRALDDYELEFEVVSPYGVTSTFKVVALVKDMSAPEIIPEYSKLSYTFLESDIDSGKAYSIIENSIVAVDNMDLFDVDKCVEGIEYNEDSEKYIAKLALTDREENKALVDIEIVILNDKRIRIEMDSAYSIISPELEMQVGAIIEYANIKAYTADDTEVKVQIDGDSEEVLTEPGIYFVDLFAESEEGDYVMAQHIIFVPDQNAPTFFLDESKVIVENSKLYTKKDFENIIRMKVGNKKFIYEVVEDQYTENYTQAGEYNYEVEVTFLDEEGNESLEKTRLNFVMKVMENEKQINNDIQKLSTFAKFWETIKKIGQKIFAVIKWPIQYLGKFF